MTTQHLPSRGALGWLGAMLGGGLSAAAFVAALSHAGTMLVFMAYIASFPLFVVGLGAGSVNGALAAVLGSLGVYLVTGLPGVSLSYVFLYALPATMLMSFALRARTGSDQNVYWYPEGYVLTALALYPCCLFLGFVALTSGVEGGLLEMSSKGLHEAALALTKNVQGLEADKANSFVALMDRLPLVLPSFIGIVWMFLMMANGLAAQSTLRQQGWHIRPSFDFQGVHVPEALALPMLFFGVSGLLAPMPYAYIGGNLCAMLCLPFLFVGLAVVHAWAATRTSKTWILVAFYVVLSFFVWLAIPVILLGLLDQRLRLRERLTQNTKLA